jgi:mono/diheme cytochrome c family protein
MLRGLRRCGLRRRRFLFGLVFLVLVSGCTREQWHRLVSPDDIMALFSWFSVMQRSPAIQPYKMPLQPVEGTVPVSGTEVVLPAVPQNQAALDRLRNPVQRTAASIERGRDRYDIYCAVCHGADGLGDGPVASSLANAVRNLTDQRVLDQSDGWMYAVIAKGFGALMPGYGGRIQPEDRWHIVNYVRTLQGGTQ